MAAPALEVRDLSVSVGVEEILDGLSLRVGAGEIHVLMGPNGSGKTTLLQAIMGMPGYRVTGGDVFLGGEQISDLSPDERSRAGLALAFQKPPGVRGVTLHSLASSIVAGGGKGERDIQGLAAAVAMEPFLERDLNVGLSGGELKRSEMFQLLALAPRVALFDEPESGVDLDNISVVGEAMRSILGIGRGRTRKAGLIVTHTGHILDYVPADEGHVLMNGAIVCRGRPRVLFEDIARHGYEGCLTCPSCRN